MIQDRRGDAIEAAVPASTRHEYGQYFTPAPLIELVLSLVDPPDGVVLDFACGSGRFLLGARRFQQPLRGFETDPAALDAARSNLPDADLSATDFLTLEGAQDVALIVGNPPYVRRRGLKRDLYVDFLERSAAHLQPGGQLALVLSNAWMDAGYGAEVRELLLRDFAIEWIVEGEERWFEGAKVHTVVLVARKGRGGVARFGRVQTLPGPVDVLREVPQASLPSHASWGPYLRAPQAWFDVDRSTMSTLGELAEIRRGFTTNDNGFFYPPEDAGIEAEHLIPLLKGPKRVSGLEVAGDALPDRVFVVDGPPGPGAQAWIGDRESWTLRPLPPARLFLFKGIYRGFRAILTDRPVLFDQQVYGLYPRPGVPIEGLAAVLNSSWARLEQELAGRVNFGQGVLWMGLKDLRDKVRLPDPRTLPRSVWAEVARSNSPAAVDAALKLDVAAVAEAVTDRRIHRSR